MGADDFNRANGGPGADWTLRWGVDGFVIDTNEIEPDEVPDADCGMEWNAGATPDDDQWAEITIVELDTLGEDTWIGPGVRMSANNGYGYYANGDQGQFLFEIVGGSWNQLTFTATDVNVDEVLRLDVSGSTPNITLTCTRDGSTTGTPAQVTNETSHANGRSGVVGYGSDLTGASTCRGDDYLDSTEPTGVYIPAQWPAVKQNTLLRM